MKLFLKKYCSRLVEGVNLIFRIVSQISCEDNVSLKPENQIGKRLLSKYSICFNVKGFVCNQGWIHSFFLVCKFKFIDFKKTKFKSKFFDFEKTKFQSKFIDFEKT